MYDVNSGGVQPCDTFLSTRKAPDFHFRHACRVRQSARTSLDRPARSLGRGRSGSGARDPATRAEDPGPSRGTGPPPRPPSPLAETRKVPGRYPTRCGAFSGYILFGQLSRDKRAKRPLVPCQRVSWMSRTCTRWLSRLNYCVDDDVRGVLDVDRL